MKHVGIICEYNPLHRGHAHLLGQVREAEAVVCLMSGNFTQRGEAASLPPVPRAAMAVAAGADLVLELPFPHAAASARYFATAGVRALSALGVDTLAFGSEGGVLAPLQAAADRAPEGDFFKKPANGAGKTGIAAAYFEALGDAPASNDILAVEYLRAIRVEQLPLSPLPVRRVGAGYRETVWENGEFASATAIRHALAAGEDVTALLPPESAEIFTGAVAGTGLADIRRLGDAMLARLRALSAESGQTVAKNANVAEAGGGLLQRLIKASFEADDYESLCRAAATKRYTDGRIRRVLLYLLAGVTEADLHATPTYLRLLAANEKGRAFLAKTEKTRTVPVVTKQSEIAALGTAAARQRALGQVSDGLYAIALNGRLTPHALQTAKPYFFH